MNETSNGMKREDKSEKLNHLSYWTAFALKRYGAHMKKGEVTHGRGNFQKGGMNHLDYLESIQRHLIAAWEHLDDDCYEGSEDHLAAIIFNAQALMNEQHLKDTLANELKRASQ
jgi:hypothetical protein